MQLSTEFEVAMTYIQCPSLKGSTNHFFVCVECNIVSSQIVNDKHLPLLPVIPVTEITQGKLIPAALCTVMFCEKTLIG